MALRAGYYGIKRGLKAKLTDIAGSWEDLFKGMGILSAKNRCPVPDKTVESRNVTYVMVSSTGVVTANGTVQENKTSYGTIYDRTENYLSLPAGRYKMKCEFTKQAGVEVDFLTTRDDAVYYYGKAYSSDDIFDVEVLASDKIGIGIVAASGTVLTNKTFAPMIWLANDPDATVVPYAMTNKELTDSAADQKTTINAIITAATGAADFAAFKAAMEAITPVTRSLNREATPEVEEPEEVIEEPVTKKRTTKKTIKEGE